MSEEKKRRTPREKKQLEYTKDFVTRAEYPNAFSKSWPRKEARTHRAFRRKIHQLNRSLQARAEDDFPDEVEPQTIRRELVRKRSVVPMGKVVAGRAESQLMRTAWNFYKKPYESDTDRSRYVRFLESQTLGRSNQARALASLFEQALDINKQPIYGVHSQDTVPKLQIWPQTWHSWHTWLQDFFNDEPEWEQRLREWIASFK